MLVVHEGGRLEGSPPRCSLSPRLFPEVKRTHLPGLRCPRQNQSDCLQLREEREEIRGLRYHPRPHWVREGFQHLGGEGGGRKRNHTLHAVVTGTVRMTKLPCRYLEAHSQHRTRNKGRWPLE